MAMRKGDPAMSSIDHRQVPILLPHRPACDGRTIDEGPREFKREFHNGEKVTTARLADSSISRTGVRR